MDNLFWALTCTGALALAVAASVAFLSNEMDRQSEREYTIMQLLLAGIGIVGWTALFYILLAVG